MEPGAYTPLIHEAKGHQENLVRDFKKNYDGGELIRNRFKINTINP